ncbi:MAG: hypothetical protein EXR75_02420 [Myxococcales bacterium]|nr:hypothetical protein [Myxococcales bacterium]
MLAAFGLAAGVATGCASGTVDFANDAGGGSSSPGAGGSGEAGGAGGVADGAGGVADGGNGAEGGSVGPLPCGVDCATIGVPACQKAQCNLMTKQCEVISLGNGAGCDDGKFCTVKDACQNGICVGGPVNDCGLDPPECTQLTCEEATKKCGTTPQSNGASCISQDLCVVGGKCQNGVCGGQVNDCFFAPVPNECFVAVCEPATGQCKPQPGNDNGACTDLSDLCTVGKTCLNGVCGGGKPKDCSLLSKGCNDGLCDTVNGQCFAKPLMQGQACLEKTDVCNTGFCDSVGKCIGSPINEGLKCDDKLSCTVDTICTTGMCTGGTSNIVVYFADDFSTGAKGWTLGTEWQIGATKESSGQVYGAPDPAADHSPSLDNGVAGVVLGGNAATGLHDYYWLESPAVNTAAAQTVYFEFWRWLNSDYTRYMANKVEVFNGTTWVNLWTTAGSPGIQDSAWTKVSYDITAHKSATMKVRFGFTVTSGGVFTVSQWNVDDVLLSNGPCL